MANGEKRMQNYLVQVDDGLPEVVLLLVEVPHTHLTKVTRMVLFSVFLSAPRLLFVP